MVSTKRSTVANATNSSIEIIVPSGKLSGFDFRDWLKVKPGDLDSSFSLAVRAAIKAYAETGRMVNAALAYAAHGIPVFPLSIHSKAPIPARDKDANGEPIPGTGGFKKATTDPEQIRKWWWKNKRHLIGIPMGAYCGVWALDVDTNIEHTDDGIAAWEKLTAEHGEIITREHRTATNGLHLIFNWSTDRPIGCSRGLLPNGIEVKAHGGYIAAPPSRRKNKSYTVSNDIDPIDAPAWLYDLIGRRPGTFQADIDDDDDDDDTPAAEQSIWDKVGLPPSARNHEPTASVEELQEALSFIPNNLDWNEWSNYGLAIYAATNGNAFDLFDEFSSKSPKYDSEKTLERWNGIQGSPPDRTGAYYIFKRAIAFGWKTAPTHPPAQFNEIEKAREQIRRVVHDFLNHDKQEKNWFEQLAEDVVGPTQIVWAERSDTGLGKTTITIEEIAKSDKRAVYAVPTLRLGDDIEQQFLNLGVSARLFRGREADDPENPGMQMCLDLDKVDIALRTLQDVSETCCKSKNDICPFYEVCGYQRQKAKGPRVWVVAADMLFHEQPALGTPQVLIIDEAIWKKSLRGIDDGERWEIPLASLSESYRPAHRALALELSEQEDDGGLQRQYVECMQAHYLSRMIGEEWHHMPKLGLCPGMSKTEYNLLMKNKSKVIQKIIFSRHIITILEELRHMVHHPEIKISGRLQLEQGDQQQRVITWRGVATIKSQFQVPTLLLDATLPDLKILRVLHPEAKIVADIHVDMPTGVKIRQILDTPTSSNKLINAKNPGKNREAVRRYILQRWFETNRQSMLVICQMEMQQWLEGKLPENISLGHYNAIAGLDEFRDVRVLILIGRTQPGPQSIETLSATLSGSMPSIVISQQSSFNWFRRVRRGIRMKDGKGVAVLGDKHPDEFCESVRQQITESEPIQAVGRARGVNRNDETPLDIDLMFDTVLPASVDEVAYWEKPSLFYATAIDGVVLESPTDLVRVWPTIWANEKAAYRSIKDGIPKLPGPKMKTRVGRFDLTLIPNPRRWLEEHLGRLLPPLRKMSECS